MAYKSMYKNEIARAAGIPMVLVKYLGRYLVCTHETMCAYGLEYVRNT